MPPMMAGLAEPGLVLPAEEAVDLQVLFDFGCRTRVIQAANERMTQITFQSNDDVTLLSKKFVFRCRSAKIVTVLSGRTLCRSQTEGEVFGPSLQVIHLILFTPKEEGLSKMEEETFSTRHQDSYEQLLSNFSSVPRTFSIPV